MMATSRPPRSALTFRAIPFDRAVQGRIGPKGVLILQWPGEMDMPAFRDPAVLRAWPEIMHDPALPLALPTRVDAVLNLCASPEQYTLSLAALDSALRPGVAVLNHPRAVMWTRRDLICRALARIPFLRVPKVWRFQPETPRDVMASFEAGSFHYPVRLEPATTDEGLERHDIAHPGDWAQVFRSPWAGRVWIMTQSSHDLSPWRIRIGMAGPDAHFEVYLDGPPPGGPPPGIAVEKLRAIVTAVRRSIPLDVATLVLALDADRPVVERFDAGLPMPATDAAPAAVRASSQRVRTALQAPLGALLNDISLWRTDATRLPALATASPAPRPEGI
jgi:hypothetical protein